MMHTWLALAFVEFWETLGTLPDGKSIAQFPFAQFRLEQVHIPFVQYQAADSADGTATELSHADMWEVLRTTLLEGEIGLVLPMPAENVEVLGTTVGAGGVCGWCLWMVRPLSTRWLPVRDTPHMHCHNSPSIRVSQVRKPPSRCAIVHDASEWREARLKAVILGQVRRVAGACGFVIMHTCGPGVHVALCPWWPWSGARRHGGMHMLCFGVRM